METIKELTSNLEKRLEKSDHALSLEEEAKIQLILQWTKEYSSPLLCQSILLIKKYKLVSTAEDLVQDVVISLLEESSYPELRSKKNPYRFLMIRLLNICQKKSHSLITKEPAKDLVMPEQETERKRGGASLRKIAQESVMPEQETVEVELMLDWDIENIKKADIVAFLKELIDSGILPLDFSVRIGSVILTLELLEEEAETLFVLIKTGKLKKFGIINARLKKYEVENYSEAVGGKPSLISTLKELVINDPEAAIEETQRCLNGTSKKNNELVLLKRRINVLKQQKNTGEIDHAAFNIEMQRVSESIISVFDSIAPSDFI